MADIPVVGKSHGGGGDGPGESGGGADDANPVFKAWLQAGLELLGHQMPIESGENSGGD